MCALGNGEFESLMIFVVLVPLSRQGFVPWPEEKLDELSSRTYIRDPEANTRDAAAIHKRIKDAFSDWCPTVRPWLATQPCT